MKFHDLTCDEAVKELATDSIKGLPEEEVRRRLKQYGENKLRAKKKKTNWQRFLDQFKDVMILILIAAAVVSFAVACTEGDPKGFFEPSLILLIVVLNALMGVMQESRAEKALDALKNMSAPHARVLRDGTEAIVDAATLVPGDIILLEAGDFVPADARLLESAGLKSEESALTGESVPSEKDAKAQVPSEAPLGDRKNMVFSGCSITYGTAAAVVTATGMDTEMGKIAGLLDAETDTQTPLQQKLAQMGKYLGIMALAACAVIFVERNRSHGNLYDVGVAGGVCHSGRLAGHCDDCAFGRRAAHGEEKCADPPPSRCGNIGERVRDLLGQDRYPDAKPYDGREGICGRMRADGGNRRGQFRRGEKTAVLRYPCLGRLGSVP